MREISLALGNYILHIIATYGLIGIQVSLWLHFFGYSPPPQIWICALNYWALRRRNLESIAMGYLLVYMLAPSTGMPLNVLFPVVLTLLGLILLMKNRVIWSGLSHYTISTAVSGFALPPVVWIWSLLIEPTSVQHFHFFSWILSPLLTALTAVFIYPLLSWLDRLTNKEAPRESESGII